jgi:hypothetical protein
VLSLEYLFGSLDVFDDAVEQLLDAVARLRRSFAETHATVLSLSLPLLFANLPIFPEVTFVASQNGDGISAAMFPKQFKPGIDSLIGILPCDIIDKDSTMRISDIVGYQRLEFFLSGCIPKLKPIQPPLILNILD